MPVRPGTRFGLASVTKMFTAVAVVDQVSTLLPEVTVRQLVLDAWRA